MRRIATIGVIASVFLGCGDSSVRGPRSAESSSQSVSSTAPVAPSSSPPERRVEPRGETLEYGDPSDIEKWLGRAGVNVKLAHCDNIRAGDSVTRGLSCTTTLTPDQVKALAASFGLDAKKVVKSHDDQTGHCIQRSAFASGEVERRAARWGCGPPDRGFGYLELHVTATGEACIETEYNWSC